MWCDWTRTKSRRENGKITSVSSDPVNALIHAMKQVGMEKEGTTGEFPRWPLFVAAFLLILVFVGFQWNVNRVGKYTNLYEISRNILGLAIWLFVVLSAFREGFGFGALCLFMPPYLLFYTIAHMESPVLRGVFYGILFSIISEIYLMREHSILLATGSAINEFIRNVDELIKHASQGPM